MVDNIGSCIEEMTTLFGSVNVNGENIRKNELWKQQQVIGINEINLRRTSIRQRKVPVTRKEDSLW
jgi:hypothetical protein